MNEVKKAVLYPADIAEATGLGLNMVYKLLKTGQIKHIKAGDRFLCSRANFDAWLNGQNQPNVS